MTIAMTRTLTISIAPELFSRYPSLKVDAFVASGLDRASAALTPDVLRRVRETTGAVLARRGITTNSIGNVRSIQRWRRAFAASGVTPAVFAVGVEKNLRRALFEAQAPAVPIVALYQSIGARHLASIAAHDLDAIPGSVISLRPVRPMSDWFFPLGARPTDIPPAPRAVVYAAGDTVLCWSFNHRDSRQTCLTRESRRAVFLAESLASVQARSATAALDDLRRELGHEGVHLGPVGSAGAAAPDVELAAETDAIEC
jgi:DNA/RNA-binding domain of Phe-tRNA-synthetase-like protein